MANKRGGKRSLCIAFTLLVVMTTALAAATIYFIIRTIDCEGQQQQEEGKATLSINKAAYGQINGKDVDIYTLKNGSLEVKVINYGATITSLFAPDKNGKLDDVVLGYDDIDDYDVNAVFFGSIIGRYANRIGEGRFTLDGVNYTLAVNDPPNSLHGGTKGFHRRLWDADIIGSSVVMAYTSADGEEGYPGEVKVTVTFSLTERHELIIDYRATTSKATVINLTSHPYFNLAGHDSGTIDSHVIRIDADLYTPLDSTQLPTGTIDSVDGTMFDLRADTILGPRLPKVPGGIGYNTNYALGRIGWDKHAARIRHPESGRTLDVYTTEPGLMLYTAYYLDGVAGKSGAVYNKFGAFCLEAQHYPDSPNEPRFPTTILRSGDVYKQTTKYVFGVQES